MRRFVLFYGTALAVLALPLCAFGQLTDGFAVRFGSLPGQVNNNVEVVESLGLVPRTSFSGAQMLTEDIRELYDNVLDFGGGTGNFAFDNDYPGRPGSVGSTANEDFFIQVIAQATLPAGTYQINVGSDDGGLIGFEGIPISNPMNFNGTPPRNDWAWFNAPRGQGNTTATITVPQQTTTTFHAMFYERGGGDQGEFSIRDASGGEVGFSTADFALVEDGILGINFEASLDMLEVDLGPVFVGGIDTVGGLANVPGIFTPTEVTRLDNPVDGLFMQVYAVANFGSKGAWDSFLSGLPAADGEGIVEWINWDEGGDLDGYLFAQPILDAIDPNADPLNFDASNYNARLTGELLVESTGDILFKDGNDDFTYFALDQDGDGEIGANEVLINDNAWTQWDGGSANGGSPIATANITGDISGENGWRKMEFLMGEGGGDDNAALFWSENAGGFLDDFTQQTDPLGVPELVPPENFRTFMEQVVSASIIGDLNGEVVVMDVLVEQIDWDRIGMAGGAADNLLRLDGSEFQINVLDPENLVNGFTIDLIRDDTAAIEGTPALTFLNTDANLWDTSNIGISGQITYTGGAMAQAGDYDGDGFVGQGDIDLVLLNWGDDVTGGAPAGWVTNLPGGNVDQDELDAVLLNWGEGSQGLGQAGVPEPSTIVMLLIAAGIGLGLIRRKR